jgi:glycosyltransferase involved in cell wall biosynthesis
MRIAFVANGYLDPEKPNSWSGLPHFMRGSLEGAGVEVETFMLREPLAIGTLFRYAYWKLIRRKRFIRACEEILHRSYARQIERSLRSVQVDAVFCPSSWPVAYCNADVPMIFWTDACFGGMLNFYKSFSDLAPPSVAHGHAAERAALRRCARAIYSSAWAAATARESYFADESKVRIVPFGGNVEGSPPLSEVRAFVAQRDLRQCNLLLIGVDWERKGAEIAVEAVKALNERGHTSRLTIIGCTAPQSQVLPPYVEVIPFVDKATPEGSRRFNEICSRSHFLVMPSRAEAFGLAIIEGNYFGLPCLATDIGGIPSIVVNGVNGRLFDLKARGSSYADYILELLRDPPRYQSLAVGAAQYADKQFSWKTSGARVAAIINEVVVAQASGLPLSEYEISACP